uniref:peptidylprolyl isomerase n=1 Tax=Ciona savignyi TaxID=51511 RepID=H2YC11_CIOSA
MPYEQMYLDNMPDSDRYERSFMHRDTLTHVCVTKTDFVLTASSDGHVKFWKKQERGVEFVKHFRAHLGAITCMSASYNGELMCTVADDKAMKVFDVVNFDMINMIKLGYIPSVSEWVYSTGSRIQAVAVSEQGKGEIFIYDGSPSWVQNLSQINKNKKHICAIWGGEVIHTLKIHSAEVTAIRYNPKFRAAISGDAQGMLEYWGGQENDFKFPKSTLKFEFKTDTDLYELAKLKCHARTITVSPDGLSFACLTSNRRVIVFKFLNGKKSRVYDESLNLLQAKTLFPIHKDTIAHFPQHPQTFIELQRSKAQLANMEFGRRVAVERELAKNEGILSLNNVIFDDSGNFLLYATMLGVKVINLHTNKCCRIIGKMENIRLLNISMFQGSITKSKAALTADMKASDNPALQATFPDPTIFATAYNKNRFYIFSRISPDDSNMKGERDVFNERPSKDEMMAATQTQTEKRVGYGLKLDRIATKVIFEMATIHTSMGDIVLKLFPAECPKSVENFCVHSRNGYYNGHIFHRIIKGFMIQTGDPKGTGSGGESIWGGEFDDEFHPSLRHDRPYTLSMANAGPNTNGSQFFITVVPTPWLDNKHTVFGRVSGGMEVVHNIAQAKVHPKTDKPYDDITIINISVK